MKKYRFDLQRSTINEYNELAHIIHAWSLADAVQKFIRKHGLEAPAYWDEPSYEKHIEMVFKNDRGSVWYSISW